MRGVRAAVLAVPTVGTAAVGHAVVDGCDSAFALLVVAGLCWPAAVALLGKRRGTSALLAWVVGAQVGAHLVLAALCGDGVGHVLVGVSASTVVAHLLAAAVTAGFLGRADAGLWAADAVVRLAGRALRLPRLVAPDVLPSRARRTPLLVPPVRGWVVRALPARRGPPVQAALAS